ncbi:unnamed protein product [Ostreobium quekettii]|uniref:ABC transporter domain-containing protein n=1 Tax=Ostreobium quekettii TaxID=121088 RepID=A0A8S1IMN5_9CHLO|nr:unnamed protein product [Ostreobium quekettii]|eukprot:evm.model.scf_39.9 EVM.evm.TU.scf_39.9   scf_39:79893-94489(+)
MVAASLKHQSGALLRKNLVYQKRRCCLNVCTILLPLLFVGMLAGLQRVIDNAVDTADNRCGCRCECCEIANQTACRIESEGSECTAEETCSREFCGLEFSTSDQAPFCRIEHPISWPPAMETPNLEIRAQPWAPGAVMFHTAQDTGLSNTIASFMFSDAVSLDLASNKFVQLSEEMEDFFGELFTLQGFVFGSSAEVVAVHQVDPAFVPTDDEEEQLFVLNQDCSTVPDTDIVGNFTNSLLSQNPLLGSRAPGDSFINSCVNTPLVLSTADRINRHLFCSFEGARCNASEEFGETFSGRRLLDESDTVAGYSNAWDFKGSDNVSMLDVDIWYKDSDTVDGNDGVPQNHRVTLPLDLAANSWLKVALDGTYSSRLLALMEFPIEETKLRLDFTSFLSVLLFTWVIQLFLPVMLVQLVYEKVNRLRIMMKMHGLGDGAYWVVTYLYYLTMYIVYMAVFIAIGSAANLAIFRLNDYGVQIVFYFLFGNVQIAFAFLLSSFFHSTLTAMVFSFLWVFKSGLLGDLLLRRLIERDVFYVKLIQLVPAFGAYRGWYELGEHSFRAALRNSDGLEWDNFTDDNNHMDFIMVAFLIEWPIFMMAAWYIEQVYSAGTGVHRHPLYFLDYFMLRPTPVQQAVQKGQIRSMQGGTNGCLDQLSCCCCRRHEVSDDPKEVETIQFGSQKSHIEVGIDEETEEVAAERRKVECIPATGDDEHVIVVRGLRKVFPPSEGNPPKVAVKELYMTVRKGEVFGLLGPNGAGKTTSINMLVGFMEPTAGSSLVNGLDITKDMDLIYDRMGVCPQHNLLWGTLTGAEHLLFYGRLKGLSGAGLKEAVENALKSVHLFAGGVGDRLVKAYSGGMKRRLSVAISLIGDPKVVYLDEPSTGLDPASRRSLWDAVKRAKKDKAMILTTHSMQEAGVLCDRLGIFVNGRLVVIGSPQQLTSRHGDYMVFTITTAHADVDTAKRLVTQQLTLNARLTYEVGGTLMFELPAGGATPGDVFAFVENIKSQIQVLDWAVTNATLEQVFIKVAAKAGATSEELH